MAELKPCPFCGVAAKLQTQRPHRGKRTTTKYRIVDGNLECAIFPVTRWYDTKEKAIETWNRRAGDGK